MAVQAHYNNHDYKNWLRACLGLTYLKEGLVDFVDAEIKRLHAQIITNVCGAGFCNQCVTNRLTDRKRHQQCPNNVCHNILKEIEKHHRYTRPCWENTDATKWCTDHWEIGKCFMAKCYAASPTAMETDCTGLLSICINGKFLPLTITGQIIQPAGRLGMPTDIFHKNRDARNALLHSASMSISDAERRDYIDDMIKLLANYKTPVDHVTQCAIDKLNELNGGIFITPTDELTALKSKLDAIDSSQQDIKQDLQGKVDNIREQTNTGHRDLATKIDSMEKACDTRHRDLGTKVDTVLQEQTRVRTNQGDLETKINTIKQEVDAGQRDLGTKVDTVLREQTRMHTSQGDLQTKVNSIKQQVDADQQDVASKVDDIQQRIDFTQSNQDSIKKELETKVETMHLQVDANQQNVDDRLDTIERRVETEQKGLEAKVETVYQRVEVCQRDVENKVDIIEQRVDTNKEDLEAKLTVMQHQYDSSRQDIEVMQQEQSRVDIVSIEQQIQKNGESLSLLNEKLLQYQLVTGEGIRDVKQQYSSLIDGNDALLKLITDLPKSLESIEGKLTHEIDIKDSQIEKQEFRMSNIEDHSVKQDCQISNIEDHTAKQDFRMSNIEERTAKQDSRIKNIEHDTARQDARMSRIEDRTSAIEAHANFMHTKAKTNDTCDISSSAGNRSEQRHKSMKDIQMYLMAKYKQELKKIPMPPLLQRIKVNLDDVYTELIIRDDLVHKATRKTVGDDPEDYYDSKDSEDNKESSIEEDSDSDDSEEYESDSEDERSWQDIGRNESRVGGRVKNYADILNDGKEPCKNVFVIGKAGVGKTTWSRKLISTWCDAMNQGASNTRSSSNEAALRKYDLVFYIELRSAKSVSHIMNMIEGQLFPHEPDMMKNVKTLMENEEYSSRCLIVLDGLDEWVSLNQSTTKNGLPARDPRWKSTIITTTRSWKLDELQLETQAIDRAVKIQGLHEYGAERLVKEVVSALNIATGKHKHVDEFNSQCHQLVHRCMEVPLLLNTFVCLWYEEGHIDELLAGTFRGLVELLIKYAEGDAQKRLSQKIPSEKLNEAKQAWKGEMSGVPDFLFKRRLCSMYGPFLLRLGNIAFDHLFSRSRESSLVFDHESITDVISEEELEIAVTIGLLSRTTHCGSILEEQFSLSFLHKTLQEFLASVYMVSKGCQSNPCLETYRGYCTDVYKVLEMENVLMFVSGVCPEIAGKMSRHIASMERNSKIHKLLMRCVRQERTTSNTSRHIYIKHHFLYDKVQSRQDGLDYNAETISQIGLSNDKDTTLCLNIGGNLDILKCIADITNIKLVEATMTFNMSESKILEFANSISVMNNKVITDKTCLKIFLSGAYLEKLNICHYRSPSERYMLDLSGCKSLKTLTYEVSTVPIQLPTEQLEEVEIGRYTPDNAPVLDLSGCKSLRTLKYTWSTVPIQLPTEQLEEVEIYSYTLRKAPILDLSGCKSLRTVMYYWSTVPIQLPIEQLEKVKIVGYTPDNAPVLDLSGCKSLRTVEYSQSTALIQLSTDQLEEVEIWQYTPRDASMLDLSGCKSLRTLKYEVSTVPIQLPTEQLEEVGIFSYQPRDAPMLDLSGCKSLRTVQYTRSTAPIQLPTEQLEAVVIESYTPRDASMLDLSRCKSLRTVQYKLSTAPIQLPTEQLKEVVIESYTPDNVPVLDLSGCKSLRTVEYNWSTAPIQLPTEQLVNVVIYSYKPHNVPVLDLSGCKSLRTVEYRESTVPIQLPTEQLEEVEIYKYTPVDASVLDLSGCKSLRTVEYGKSTVLIQLPTEQLEKVVIDVYTPDNAPVLDLARCKSLRTVQYVRSTAPIQLPTEQLEEVVIFEYTPRNAPVLDLSRCKSLRTLKYRESTAPIQLPTEQLEMVDIYCYKPRTAPVLDLSGCKSLKCIRYFSSTTPVQLPPEQALKVKVNEYTPQSYWLLERRVPTPLLDRDMCLLEVDSSSRKLIHRR